MRNLLATAALAAALISPTPAQAKCLKLTDPKVQTEIDVLANKSGQSKAQIFSILDNFECSGVPRSQAFETVVNTIRNMQDMRNNSPGSTAMREQMMAGLRGRDRAAMEETFDDLHRLAKDNNLAGFLNRLKEKGDDLYRAHLERNDPSAPQFIASEREQAKACTPERIAASAERAKDCAPEQSTAAPAQRPRTSPSSPSATSGPAQNYTAKQFLDDYRKGGAEAQQLLRLHAQAFQEGVMWANVYNSHEGREAAVLYCSPSKIVLQGEQVIDILRREVEARPELAQEYWGLAMMEALRKAFPCHAGASARALL